MAAIKVQLMMPVLAVGVFMAALAMLAPMENMTVRLVRAVPEGCLRCWLCWRCWWRWLCCWLQHPLLVVLVVLAVLVVPTYARTYVVLAELRTYVRSDTGGDAGAGDMVVLCWWCWFCWFWR